MAYQVLVADDSATMRKVIELTFARENVSLTQVDSGSEAIERAKRLAPNLALIDVSLGDGNNDGYAVCRSLKNNPTTAQIPVILMGSKQTPFDESKAAQSGADGHVIKPFETKALIDRVMSLLITSSSSSSSPKDKPRAVTAATGAALQPNARIPRPTMASTHAEGHVATPIAVAPPAHQKAPPPAATAGARPIATMPPPVRHTAPPPAPVRQPTASMPTTNRSTGALPKWTAPIPAATGASGVATPAAHGRASTAEPIPSSSGGAPPPPPKPAPVQPAAVQMPAVQPAAVQMPDRREDPFGLRLGMLSTSSQPRVARIDAPASETGAESAWASAAIGLTRARAVEPSVDADLMDAFAGLPITPPPPLEEEPEAIEAHAAAAAIAFEVEEEEEEEEEETETAATASPDAARIAIDTDLATADVFDFEAPDKASWLPYRAAKSAPPPVDEFDASSAASDQIGAALPTNEGNPSMADFEEPTLRGGDAWGDELNEEVVKKAARAATAEPLSGLPAEFVTEIATDIIERVAWDVVPQIAEQLVREHLARLLKTNEPS